MRISPERQFPRHPDDSVGLGVGTGVDLGTVGVAVPETDLGTVVVPGSAVASDPEELTFAS